VNPGSSGLSGDSGNESGDHASGLGTACACGGEPVSGLLNEAVVVNAY
jgi:hypothetical protein